jgi:hypothetical protein
MEKLILVIGALLTLLNTIIGLVIPGYATFNFLLADLSIILSTGLIYRLLDSGAFGGFEMALTYIFCFTGIVRWVCVAFASPEMENDMTIICAATLLFLEIVCLLVAVMIEKKNKR